MPKDINSFLNEFDTTIKLKSEFEFAKLRPELIKILNENKYPESHHSIVLDLTYIAFIQGARIGALFAIQEISS